MLHDLKKTSQGFPVFDGTPMLYSQSTSSALPGPKTMGECKRLMLAEFAASPRPHWPTKPWQQHVLFWMCLEYNIMRPTHWEEDSHSARGYEDGGPNQCKATSWSWNVQWIGPGGPTWAENIRLAGSGRLSSTDANRAVPITSGLAGFCGATSIAANAVCSVAGPFLRLLLLEVAVTHS